ncbi:MAG: glycoside hydrolase family 3 N-terminal domain-containing protein [Actinomycetota bacterium]
MKFDELDRAILAHFSPGFGGTEIPSWLTPYLENGVGGVTLFSSNTPAIDSAADLVEKMRSLAPEIIISIDEEGGDVTRLYVTEGSPFPTPALLGRCNDIDLTTDTYFELGKILNSIGVDLNLAPVADVSIEVENPIVGVRSFSADFDISSRHVIAAITGLRRAGVASCIKHFPGHGGVIEDSHHELPKLIGSQKQLESTHLKPFISAISAGVEAVMTGHIVMSALDDKNPASCSQLMTEKYLKHDLGFSGLVVTDALDMGALGGPKKIHQSALRAIKAGADLLCFSGLYDQSIFLESSLKHIREAIDTGELSSEKVLSNAEKLRSWKSPKPQGSSVRNMPEFDRFLSGIFIQGDVALKGDQIQLIEISADPTIAAGFVGWGLRRALTTAGIRVKLESSDIDLGSVSSNQIVVAFRDAFRDNKVLAALEKIHRARPDSVFVDMGWPTLRFKPDNLIRTYGSSALASELATKIMTKNVIG